MTEKIEKGKEEPMPPAPESVARMLTTAQKSIVRDHSGFSRIMEAAVDIAYGDLEVKYESDGKTAGTGCEILKVRAIQADCIDFVRLGGTAELLKLVNETVYMIVNDPASAEFADEDGCVWASASKIAQEAARSIGGTLSRRQARSAAKLVSAAVRVLAGMKLYACRGNGDMTAFTGILNAKYGETVLCQGNAYREVFGFSKPKPHSIIDEAFDLGQARRYGLPPVSGTYSLDKASYRRYIMDMLNMLRGQLWTRDKETGEPIARKNASFTLTTRDYQLLFDLFFCDREKRPIKADRKRKFLEEFQEVFIELAREEAAGAVVEGMHMSLETQVWRDPSKGKGAGAWDYFVVTARPKKGVEPKIDLIADEGYRKSCSRSIFEERGKGRRASNG